MVKHISKIIKETELYKENERRKFEEFLPGISEADLIKKALYQPVSTIGFEGLPIRTPKKSEKVAFDRKNEADGET